MRLLDRYLLRELLIPLGYCLGGFLLFWISYDLLTALPDFQAHKLHGGDVLEYYLVRLPELLVLVLPFALLLALLYSLTDHARHHETTAIRAAGISLWRLCLPYLLVGGALSLALFLMNELWVPDSVEAADQILNRRIKNQAAAQERKWKKNLSFRNERDQRRWDIGAYNPETAEMLRPHVEWRLADGASRELFAERGQFTNGVWTFYQVQSFFRENAAGALPVPSQHEALPVREFWETPELIRSEIKINSMGSLKATRLSQLSLLEILDYRRLHPIVPAHLQARLNTQMHARLAAPWTCLVVVCIAIPFGAASGRRNVFVGVASSIFIGFAYFVLLQLGLALGSGRFLPAWFAAWAPNLSFALLGVWLTSRVR